MQRQVPTGTNHFSQLQVYVYIAHVTKPYARCKYAPALGKIHYFQGNENKTEQNIGEDTKNNATITKHSFPEKERWGTNNDKTNATYESTEAQTKKYNWQWNGPETVSRKTIVGAKTSFTRAKPHP